jgi:hypothetical protein
MVNQRCRLPSSNNISIQHSLRTASTSLSCVILITKNGFKTILMKDHRGDRIKTIELELNLLRKTLKNQSPTGMNIKGRILDIKRHQMKSQRFKRYTSRKERIQREWEKRH